MTLCLLSCVSAALARDDKRTAAAVLFRFIHPKEVLECCCVHAYSLLSSQRHRKQRVLALDGPDCSY